MKKLWVVLKVSLTRPWVWTMLPMVLFQFIPLWKFAPKAPVTEYKNAIPPLSQFDNVVTQSTELRERAQQKSLDEVQGLECRDLHAELRFDDQGNQHLSSEVAANPRLLNHGGSWPVLDQVPQIRSLVFQPPNGLNAAGFRRIQALQRLEVLQLEHVNLPEKDQKQLEQILSEVLPALPRLRQLNLNNFGGRYDWKLPPLPHVEYLILGFNTQMEANLETLAQSSPHLQTLVLHTYGNFDYTDRMLASLGKIPSLRRIIICSSSKQDTWRETQRQVEFLRKHLRDINIERGVFSPNRVILHLFLSFIAGFLPFIAWFQTGLKLSQPLAAVIPGHRGPHLFWPVSISSLSAFALIVLSMNAGTYWPTAVSLAALESMLVAAILPGHDLTARWRSVLQIISTVDVISLLSCIGLGLAAPYYADAYLMGDYPQLAALLMLWFLSAGAWKIWRATRLHRILAESGMPGIPGLSLGMQQIMDQPYKPAPGWSIAKWQLQRLEGALDRKIAGMNRSDWVDMLRKASPSNPGMWVGLFVMVIFFVAFRQFAPVPQRQALTRGPILAIGVWQATMMLMMINIMMWVSRRAVVAHEFLRPISRPLFWRHLRLAIFHDLKLAVLFGLAGGLYSTYLGNKNSLPAQTILNAALSAAGTLAWLHGWVTLAVIGKRLWLHATLGLLTSGLLFAVAAGSVALTVGQAPELMLATSLSLGLVVAGGALQWGIAYKLPDWELA